MAYSLLRTGHAGEAIDALKIAATRPGVSELWSGGCAPCRRSCWR